MDSVLYCLPHGISSWRGLVGDKELRLLPFQPAYQLLANRLGRAIGVRALSGRESYRNADREFNYCDLGAALQNDER